MDNQQCCLEWIASLVGDVSIDLSLNKYGEVEKSERLREDIPEQKNDVNKGKKSGQRR